ncbi:hypothetical protein [Novosphingobium clariflavum]|uniref:Uncharacterized protein n=1 Tax=Novosphingobium clariflavum TaxID=2029884 RepID=A0ABV6S2T7_9SPHN|nr:hypothetical protein [Novosphingobium clariflavum]
MEVLAIVGVAKKVLPWAWGAIRKHSRLLPYLAAAALVWWLWSGRQDALQQRDTARAALAAANAATATEIAAHRKTKDDYRAAQAAAARLDAERITREKARQQEINDAASKDYAQRLADLRARYQRLLGNAQPGSAAGGATGNVAVPGLPAAPGGTAGAADIRLAGAAGECLSPTERLIAAEQAAQLDALILAVERLSAKIGAPAP